MLAQSSGNSGNVSFSVVLKLDCKKNSAFVVIGVIVVDKVSE